MDDITAVINLVTALISLATSIVLYKINNRNH